MVDPAKSKFSSRTATLTLERVGAANSTAGSFIAISSGTVYRVMGATVYDGKGVQPVDYARMAKEGKAVLIGWNARAEARCGIACEASRPERRLTLTFEPARGAAQQINDMLAERKQ